MRISTDHGLEGFGCASMAVLTMQLRDCLLGDEPVDGLVGVVLE